MTKRLICCWAFIASWAILLASPAFGEVHVGFKLGYNSLHLRADDGKMGFPIDKRTLGGVSVGPMVNIDVNDFLTFQAELAYSQKGGKYDLEVPIPSSAVTVDIRETRKLDFIEVPLLLKFMIPVAGRVRPTVFLGPSLGINLNGRLDSRIRVRVLGVGLDLDEKRGLDMDTNATDLSLIFGGGVDMKLPKGTLIADARVSLGVSPYEYNVTIPTSKFASLGLPAMPDLYYDLEMSTFALSFSFGYLF